MAANEELLMSPYLCIGDDGRLELHLGDERVAITSLDQLAEHCPDGHLLCSSSIDFPHDYTSDPDVLAICNALRG